VTTLGIIEVLVRVAWLAGAGAFVIGLMRMNSPATARNGNLVSAGGMTVAIGATAILVLAQQLDGDGISAVAWIIIVVGIAIGGGAGLYTAKTVKMTAMPQLVSLFNAMGGGAAALIAIDDYLGLRSAPALQVNVATVLDIVIGSITFSGSLIASGKLMGLKITPSRPVMIPGGQLVTGALAAIVVVGAIFLWVGNLSVPVMALILLAALVFGVTMTLPIGGADMPVVISLLNSFTGTAVAMAGFVLDNPVLIIAGALVGALTKLMADAMNRSVINIMIGGFGGSEGTQTAVGGPAAPSARSVPTMSRSSSPMRVT
jgi:NAD/NADP transhydrogenase beta subunit